MATKPTYKPTWAQNDTTLPNAGTDNKLRPTSDLRDVGIDYGQQLTAQEFNWIVNNIREWIDYLEADSGVQDAAVADNSDGDAVEATLGVDSYNSEDIYWIEWPANNTSTTPTLNVNGNGAVTVISLDGDALEADALIGERLYPFWYDGSNFVVCSVLKASQADAEGGTDDKQYMTALRVHQAFSQYGLGTTSLPYISDFNNAYQLETGFYHWDDNTVGEPTGGGLTSGQPTVFITNESGVANLLAFMNTVLYTATCTSSNLSSWHTYSQTFGQVIDTQTFPSPGSFSWNKPPGANPDDTVVARIWGAGASGSTNEEQTSFVSGGQGGAFVEVSFRASNVPSSATVNVGSGGNSTTASGGGQSTGQDGENSDVFGFTARGGDASFDGSGLSQNGFTDDITSTEWLRDLWAGGLPGEKGSLQGEVAFYGGAGGGSVDVSGNGTANGGTSRYGGNGGASNSIQGGSVTADDGQSPGGGGGAANAYDGSSSSTSGAGGDGRVEIYVIRGWSPSGIITEI